MGADNSRCRSLNAGTEGKERNFSRKLEPEEDEEETQGKRVCPEIRAREEQNSHKSAHTDDRQSNGKEKETTKGRETSDLLG